MKHKISVQLEIEADSLTDARSATGNILSDYEMADGTLTSWEFAGKIVVIDVYGDGFLFYLVRDDPRLKEILCRWRELDLEYMESDSCDEPEGWAPIYRFLSDEGLEFVQHEWVIL